MDEASPAAGRDQEGRVHPRERRGTARLVGARAAVRGLAGPRPHRRARSGALLVAAGNAWYGPAVWRSEDGGETWTHSSAGLTYGDDAEPIKTIWSLAATPDGGAPRRRRARRAVPQRRRWRDVAARRRPDQPPDPADLGTGRRRADRPHDHPPPDRHRTGPGSGSRPSASSRRATAARRGSRATSAFAPSSTRRTASRRPASASTSSRWPRASPRRFYQRNHCGVYRSDDGSATWQEITGSLPTDFGFAMVAHPRDADTCWVIPLSTPEEGRYMPDGHTAVWRTHDRGASWICSDAGLPTQDAYMSVLREAMARDTLDPVGITFGTATGQLWHSSDEGVLVADDHRHAAGDLGGRGGPSSTDAMATVLLPALAHRALPGRRRSATRSRARPSPR